MRNALRYLKRIAATSLLIVVALVIILAPITVLAIADPDTEPQVSAVYVYEFDDGSVGVLIDYYLDYAVLPTETVTEAYLAVFVDTDGTTQLKSVAPYTFVDSGYGRGLSWIPFTAAEATTYGLDSANMTDYRIWLTGNPGLSWSGDPPKKIATIDQWVTTSVSDTLESRILYYAGVLELAWSLDMIEPTAVGNRLTTTGESYFLGFIGNLPTLAPDVFSNVETTPTLIQLDYSTTFAASAASGTATVIGSPVTLIEGSNTITTNTTGTILVTLSAWASGNITSGTGTLTGSPADLDKGVNTLTTTGAGTFVIALEALDTVSLSDASVTGTGFDLTTLAIAFGMSRWMMSGLVWFVITIIVCAATYKISGTSIGGGDNASQSVVLVFALMIIAGWLLNLIHPLVVAFLIIASGATIGYFLFFRSDSLHKGFMYMMWMFLIVSLAGNMAASGTTGITATYLTADVSTTEISTINVASTTGFPSSGTITIDGESIGYPRKTATTFESTKVLLINTNPLLRGLNDTTANVTHLSGATVRTVESGMFNSSIDYKIAKLTDSAGTLGFLSFPADLLSLIITFFVLPLGFFGTELAILTYIWAVVAVGMLVGFVLQLAGGRRV